MKMNNKNHLYIRAVNIISICMYFFIFLKGSASTELLLILLPAGLTAEYFWSLFTRKVPVYALLLLTPLLLIRYSTIRDFNIRFFTFSVIFLIFSTGFFSNRRTISLRDINSRKIWIFSLSVLILLSLFLHKKGVHLSGDEPHFLMISQSIVNDFDFDLTNNFRDKTYREFINSDLRFHGRKIDNKLRSFHLPGVSFIMAPFYLIFKSVKTIIPSSLFFRLSASLINSLFMLLLYKISEKIFPDSKAVKDKVLIFLGITFPVAFHAVHLYPEIPAAILAMAFFYLFFLKVKRSLVLSGLMLSLIPWFHVKYAPLIMIMTIFVFFTLYRECGLSGRFFKNTSLFLLFPVISLASVILYSVNLYGVWSPTKVFPSISYISLPLILKIKVFCSYFLDQRDGLIFYAPLFILVLPGLFFKFRYRFILFLSAFAYIGAHAFTTTRGAYSPAARPLMFVSWILILFVIGFIVKNREKAGRAISRILCASTLLPLSMIMFIPYFIYQPVMSQTRIRESGINIFLGSDFINPGLLFPSYSAFSQRMTELIWPVLLIVLAWFIIKKQKYINRKFLICTGLIMFSALTYMYCIFPHVYLNDKSMVSVNRMNIYNNSRNFVLNSKSGFFRAKNNYTYEIFILKEAVRNKNIKFFCQTDLKEEIFLSNKTKSWFLKNSSAEKKLFTESIPVRDLKSLNVRGREVIPFQITLPGKKGFSFISFQ